MNKETELLKYKRTECMLNLNIKKIKQIFV